MMKRVVMTLGLVALLMGIAMAQSGHFVVGGANEPSCVDQGTQLACSGKVAGLGGSTFEIVVEAEGTAVIECTNPGGNVAPGQDTEITATVTTGPQPTPRNGHHNFSLVTATPNVPNYPTCPNEMWTAQVIDVVFGDATITLFEDGVQSDQITVPSE